MITPVGLSSDLHPGHEVVQIGHVGQHVVADEQVGLFALGGQCPCGVGAEEAASASGHLLLARGLGDIGGRFDAEHRNARCDEVLQQIAVVARDLDDEALSRSG